MVCSLGAATLATSVTGRRDLVARMTGFAVAAIWLRPDPVWVGGLVALVGGLGLGWSRFEPISAAAAGALAGLWIHVLESYGLPGWTALPLAATVPVTAAALAHQSPRFAPLAVREDAVLTICVLGLIVAAVPALSTGWQSAGAMNLEPGGGARPDMGLWVTLGLGTVVSLGGLHTLWRRG